MAALTDTRMPGVITIENPTLPPSVAVVPSAVPCFIGYTQKHEKNGEQLNNKAVRVRNMREFTEWYGFAPNQVIDVEVVDKTKFSEGIQVKVVKPELNYRMYYAMQFYFANGGGPCFVVAVKKYNNDGSIVLNELNSDDVYSALKRAKEVTILSFPDASGNLSDDDYKALTDSALKHCEKMKNRILLLDVNDTIVDITDITSRFRQKTSNNPLEKKYGAAYYPFLNTTLDYVVSGQTVTVKENRYETRPEVAPNPAEANVADDPENAARQIRTLAGVKLGDLEEARNQLYNTILQAIRDVPVPLPPSPAIAGIMVQTDATQGVWQAPANVSVASAIAPTVEIDDDFHADLNVDSMAGKSINAIRTYEGQGVLVFGARTMAGNDLEWRYVSVRRTFCFIEDSIGRAMQGFVFAPNTRETWIKVKAMISNFLTEIWKAGGLFGNTTNEAYQVNVGSPETMSDVDILEGRMIVEIKLRVSRPAEFIILRYEHKFQANAN